MSAPVKIQISSNAQKVLARMQAIPTEMADEIRKAMDTENQNSIRHIKKARLSGHGPFPPEEGKLGQKTNQLWKSVAREDTTVNVSGGGLTATSSIGSNVFYAIIHEEGGTFDVKAHVRRVLFARGKRIDLRGYTAAVSRKAKHTWQARAKVKAHTVTFPARHPFRRGIEDRMENYVSSLSNAIVTVWNRKPAGGNP